MPRHDAKTDDARKAGHKAAQKAAAALGREWQDEAVAAIRAHAQTHATFTAEEVRAAFPDLDKIAERRAWGAAFIEARAELIVEPFGAVAVASSRGGYKTLWRSLVNSDDAEGEPAPFPPAFLKEGGASHAAH